MLPTKHQYPAFAISGALFATAVSVCGQYSAYLPEKGQLLVSPSYVYQTYDEFWAGRTKMDLGTRQHQHTALLGLEYGLRRNAAFDVTLGYTGAMFDDGPEDWGLADTTFGLRWQVSDEKRSSCPLTPTAAVRVGGIIEGTYDESFPFSAGDGASGFETSLLLGREICTGFGVYGDIGWRTRNHGVPDDLFGSAGVYFQYAGFSLSGGYRHVQGLSGNDIGDPGFSFPKVKEINQLVEASLGYTDGGGRYYSVFGAKNVDGKNTGDKWIGGVSITIPLGPYGRK